MLNRILAASALLKIICLAHGCSNHDARISQPGLRSTTNTLDDAHLSCRRFAGSSATFTAAPDRKAKLQLAPDLQYYLGLYRGIIVQGFYRDNGKEDGKAASAIPTLASSQRSRLLPI